MKNLALKIAFFIILLTPLWSYLTWLLWPAQKFNVVILDKSFPAEGHPEHRSFHWILTHEKFHNAEQGRYNYDRDYFGFFSGDSDEYHLRGLEQMNSSQTDSMISHIDMAYFVSAWGDGNMQAREMFLNDSTAAQGGVTGKDYRFLERLYRRHKLIIAEYNTLAAPTTPRVRSRMERLFQIDYTGWTGKYFSSLDTAAETEEVPPVWIRDLYRQHYNQPFVFEDIPGIVLVHETGIVIVLEDKKHLDLEIPVINTGIADRRKYNLPEFIRYPHWFEVTFSREEDHILSTFKIHTNEAGDSLLGQYNLPAKFPAVIKDDEGLRFYFCGDFADNPVQDGLAYFKGIGALSRLFYDNLDISDRRKFFWQYYTHLIENIIKEFRENSDNSEELRPLPEDNFKGYSISEAGKVLLPEPGQPGISDTDEFLNDAGNPGTGAEPDIESPVYVPKGSSPDRYRVGGRLPYDTWLAIKEGRFPAGYRGEGTSVQTNEGSAVISGNTGSSPEMWHIVIASLRSEERARSYLAQLDNPAISIVHVDRLNTNRVVYGRFTNLRDAQLRFEEVVQSHPDAWMVRF